MKNSNIFLAITKKYCLLFLFLANYTFTFGQLGFCNGSSGAPIFFENFGSGSTYGPQLPAGVTNYTYVASGFPQDGQYTLYNRTNLIPNSQNWLYSLDHTPDTEPNGLNGKCLIVNASNTPGQFYRRVVTGLCSNTTFEFTAWLLNIYNSASGGCTGTGIPINVTFEIWNATETVLLQSGSTGNIAGTSTPNWNQYGLVFTMPTGQSAVVLKMKNNGAVVMIWQLMISCFALVGIILLLLIQLLREIRLLFVRMKHLQIQIYKLLLLVLQLIFINGNKAQTILIFQIFWKKPILLLPYQHPQQPLITE